LGRGGCTVEIIYDGQYWIEGLFKRAFVSIKVLVKISLLMVVESLSKAL
jgi:hypothetical protein